MNWVKKHKFVAVLGFIIVFLFLGAMVETKTIPENAKTEVKTNTNSNTNISPASKEDVASKVGEVTKLGDREFVVNSVKRSSGFEYNTPKAGKEYVIVNVTIRNLGKDEVSYNPFDFKVQDANGAQEDQTFASLDDDLSYGTLAPGGKVTGSMPFEVPVGDKALLIYQPSFWSNQRIVVDLGNK